MGRLDGSRIISLVALSERKIRRCAGHSRRDDELPAPELCRLERRLQSAVGRKALLSSRRETAAETQAQKAVRLERAGERGAGAEQGGEGRAGGASYLQLGWRELGVQRDYQEPRADGPRAGWVSHAAIGMATERSAATRLTHLSEYGKVARSVLVSEVMRSTDGRKTRMPPSTCCRTKEMRCGVGQTGVASSLWCRDGKDAAARTVFVTRCATSAVMIDSSTAP